MQASQAREEKKRKGSDFRIARFSLTKKTPYFFKEMVKAELACMAGLKFLGSVFRRGRPSLTIFASNLTVKAKSVSTLPFLAEQGRQRQ